CPLSLVGEGSGVRGERRATSSSASLLWEERGKKIPRGPPAQPSVSTHREFASNPRSQAPLGNASAEAPLRKRLWAEPSKKQLVGPSDEAELRPARSQAELGNEMRRYRCRSAEGPNQGQAHPTYRTGKRIV